MEEQKYFQVPEEAVELRKQLADYVSWNESLQKENHDIKQDKAFLEAKNSKLTKEKEEAVKQLNDFIEYARQEVDQVKNIIIEVPCKTLYGLAFDWQTPSDSVFITVDEDGIVNLRTREEIKKAEDPEWHPPYRHWWLTKVV